MFNQPIYGNIFRHSPHCVCVINKNGDIVDFSSSFEENFMGNNAEELNLFNLFPSINLRKLKRGKKFFADYNDRKNSIQVYEVQTSILKENNENFYAVWFADVTELVRHKAVNEVLLNISKIDIESNDFDHLCQSIQNELNKLIDANNLYITLYDETKCRMKLAYISDTNSIKDDYPLGNSYTLWVAQKGKGILLNRRQISQLRYHHKLESFGPVAVSWMGVPLWVNREIIGVIAVQSFKKGYLYTQTDLDILEFISTQIASSLHRKEREWELVDAKRRAEDADRLKSAFLANMSHEIRTPMNAILGFSELLTRNNVPQEKRELYAGHVKSNGKLLLTLIGDIIDLAKIEAEQITINKTPVNVEEILEELHEVSFTERARLGKEHLAVNRQVSKNGEPLWLLCDGVRLKQVLINLLSNAIKFTQEGNIEFGYSFPNKATVQFYVKDTGIGIAPENQAIIFERFRQADNSTTRLFGGTGLGLAISKRLVELMGGRIHVESELGKGSAFFFSLPNITPSNPTHAGRVDVSAGTGKNYKGLNLLVVEDNNANYVYLSDVLSQLGFTIYRAKTGKEALHMIAESIKFSLVLLDINLPEIDGFEVLKSMKVSNSGVPVIVQSAYAFPEERKKAMEMGCQYYLTKPVTSNKLMEAIGQIL